MKTRSNFIATIVAFLTFIVIAVPGAQAGFQRCGPAHSVNPRTGKIGGANQSWGFRDGRLALSCGNLITIFDGGAARGSSYGSFTTYLSANGQLSALSAGIYQASGRRFALRKNWTLHRGSWVAASMNDWKHYYLK